MNDMWFENLGHLRTFADVSLFTEWLTAELLCILISPGVYRVSTCSLPRVFDKSWGAVVLAKSESVALKQLLHSLWVPVDASQMLWHGSPTQQVRGEEVTQVTKVESTRSIRCPDARKTAIHVENCGWIGHWNMLENACTKPIGIDWAETLRFQTAATVVWHK